MLFDHVQETDTRTKAVREKVEHTLSLTERLIGVVDWHWDFYTLKFKGEGTRRQAYVLFDEVLCNLLLLEDELSGAQMRELLGLSDDLGKKAFHKMLRPLLGDMIEGDDSCLMLTAKGKTYAKSGSKFGSYTKQFELVVDAQVPTDLRADQLASRLGKPKRKLGSLDIANLGRSRPVRSWVSAEPSELALGLDHDLGRQQAYAAAQASEVHLPEKGFFLDKAVLEQVLPQRYPVRVAIIEDFRDQEVRFLVLHAQKETFLPQISGYLNRPGFPELSGSILQHFVESEKAHLTREAKPATQVEDEEWLSARKEEAEVKPGALGGVELKAQAEAERKNFDTLGFEGELDWLTDNFRGEIWFISPWIRERAFRAREKQIRKLLHRGCKVFVAHSLPHHRGEEMVAEPAQAILENLAAEYEGFYCAALPAFHEKIVLALGEDNFRYEYTGSFNVLSFHARNMGKIGRENMRRLKWGADSEKNYHYFLTTFAEFYLQRLEKFTQELTAENALDQEAQITKATGQMERYQQKFAPLMAKSGGEMPARLQRSLHQCQSTLDEGKKRFVQAELQKLAREIEIPRRFTDKVRIKLEEKLDKLKNKWDGITDLESVEGVREKITVRFGLESLVELYAKLSTEEGDLSSKSRKRYENRLGTLERSFPQGIAELDAEIRKIRALIEEKSPIKKLKVLGKIDLSDLKRKKKGK